MENKDVLFQSLIEKSISGTITEEERRTLYALLDESEEYASQYKATAKLYALLDMRRLDAGKEESFERFATRMNFSGRQQPVRRLGLWRRWQSIAAVAALVISVSIGTLYIIDREGTKTDVMYCETVVPLGSQTKVVLPDGTVVVLNSGSILKYPANFNEKERNVELVGKGYFEVAKNKEKRFRVATDDLNVCVTGTTFNISAYPDDKQTEVDLIEGSVQVKVGDAAPINMSPDEKVVFDKATGKARLLKSDASKSALWTTGKLSFVNASLKDILKDVERKFNVKIQVMSKQVEKEYFSGTMSLDMSLQEIFNFIDVDGKYEIVRSGQTIVIRDR
ncbi:FecR domain-containing protein [Phocaeicola sp.]